MAYTMLMKKTRPDSSKDLGVI